MQKASLCPHHISRRQFFNGFTAFGGSICGGVILSGCSTNRATGRSALTIGQSLKDDINIGRAEHPNIMRQFGGAYDNKNLKNYVNDIGQSLVEYSEYKEFKYHFTILDTPQINAFALPGGYVYITRGLMALIDNEAELAGVLSHEIGHVTARHAAERIGQGTLLSIGSAIIGAATGSQDIGELAMKGTDVYLKGFSRDQEYEADLLGLGYLIKAGYHPKGSVDLLRSLGRYNKFDNKVKGIKNTQNNILSTHPRTKDRINKAQAEVESQLENLNIRSLKINRQAYLQQINNMIFGDSANEGYVRGQDFIHVIDGYRFRVPIGFTLVNSTNHLSAKHDEGYGVLFNFSHLGHNVPPNIYITQYWQQNRRFNSVKSLKLNGLNAAVGELRGRINQTRVHIAVAAIQAPNNIIYRFVFSAPQGKFSRARSLFHKTLHSFRLLNEKEKQLFKPKRLMITNRADPLLNKKIKAMEYGEYNNILFNILNDNKDKSKQVKIII